MVALATVACLGTLTCGVGAWGFLVGTASAAWDAEVTLVVIYRKNYSYKPAQTLWRPLTVLTRG